MTTNPHIKAGGLPPTELHRIEPSMLSYTSNSEGGGYAIAVDRYGKVTTEKLDEPLPVEFAGDEPDEDGPEEMLATVLILVLACLGLGSFIAGWLS